MSKLRCRYMNLAIQLAFKAEGKTFPNPLVGAVLVKNGKIISMSYHKKAGHPHAEIIAIKKAGKKAKGADLYVTLEPCCYYGKTPPCTDLIIKSGIKKVFAAIKDPNPLVNCKGIEMLNKNGVKTHIGILKEKAKEINLPFFKLMTKKLPFVTCKIAQSLDGKTATHTGQSKWITSAIARNFAKEQRKFYDGIMVGINTILKDNPRLESQRYINKIIIDSSLKTPADANIFKSGSVIITTLKDTACHKAKRLLKRHKNITILKVKSKNGKTDLKDTLKKLGRRKISNILCEGGSALTGSLFDEKLLDKVNFYISPQIIGGQNALTSVSGNGVCKLSDAFKLKNIKIQKLGEDFFIEGDVL